MSRSLTIILLAVSACTAFAKLTPPTPLDKEVELIGELTAASPLKMRFVIQTGEFPDDAYGDQFEFKVHISEGLEIGGPLSWTAPATVGVPCTTYVTARFSGLVDTCQLLVGITCGRVWDKTGGYFVITPDSVEYWEGRPYLSWAERGPRKRIDGSATQDSMSRGHPWSSVGEEYGAIPIESQRQMDSLAELRQAQQPVPEEDTVWRRMIEEQGEPFGPIKDVAEFHRRWEDSIKSLPPDHLWTVRFDLRDSVSRSIVEGVLGEGAPCKRPGYFEYRVTQAQFDELDVKNNNIKYRLIYEEPVKDPEPTDSLLPGESALPSVREQSRLAQTGGQDRASLFFETFSGGWESRWDRWDDEPLCGDDYWGYSSFGGGTLYCHGVGDRVCDPGSYDCHSYADLYLVDSVDLRRYQSRYLKFRG